MKQKLFTTLIWIVMVSAFVIFYNFYQVKKPEQFKSFETFVQNVEDELISEININDNQINVCLYEDGCYNTMGYIDDEMAAKLSSQGVNIKWGKKSHILTTILYFGVFILLLICLFIYFQKRSAGSAGNILSLRKTTARRIKDANSVTFADVGGCTEAKEILGDVIDFLKNPRQWNSAGVRLPRGILLEGAPGTGKTLLARAVAGETNARFFFLAASEFVEMFVGVGAARVRDLFETARKESPSIIFIDELDAVGRKRGSGLGAAHDEREQTLNQLLVCMDGFQNNDRVVVIAATNRADILDKALLRPGRFDRRIKISNLSCAERLDVLKIHTNNKPLSSNISLEKLADRISGFNGADIENLVNEAAMLAVRRVRLQNLNSPCILMSDFETVISNFSCRTSLFNKLDSVLVESSSQLAEPTGKALTRLTLKQDTVVEGQVLWADSSFIKLRHAGNNTETIVPKSQVLKINALDGTEQALPEDMVADPWGSHNPDLA